MYAHLLTIHSLIRWVVLTCLLVTLVKSFSGWRSGRAFSPLDNALRHWTATAAHIQLVIGIILYTQSPIVDYFWKHSAAGAGDTGMLFFGVIHVLLMLVSIVLITVGSALARRRKSDAGKFRTVFVWFTLALIIIMVAIPWPFSPLANRPYFR